MKKLILLSVFIFPVLSAVYAQNIVQAEYFWDSDPGLGNGASISIATPSPNIHEVVAVSATGLTTGIHTLYFRAKDANGKWGLFSGMKVLVTAPAASNKIVQLEYFWDTDPGIGKAKAIPVSSPDPNLSVIGAIQAAGLSPGIHKLYMRARDANGMWSLLSGTIVLVTPALSNIVKLEYFWDSDPGVGNGTSLTPTSAAFTINESFSITAPSSLSQGDHLLAIRSQNAAGTWSLFVLDTVTISGILPLQLLSFTGKKQNTSVYLEWQTTNEVNTSYFEVERSQNGVSFASIAKVDAANTAGSHDYDFTDLSPLPQVSYYRLKQIDKDGQFIYSKAIRILNAAENGILFRVSPNPASTQISVDFTTKEKTVIINIYDSEGRLVEQSTSESRSPFVLHVGHLKKGMYFIHLSDGVQTAIGKFIKE